MSHRTKQALVNSFIQLLKKKPFSKITISDITADCGITRMAFYYHFQDIYDMLDWAFEEKINKAVAANFTYATWRKGYSDVFRMVTEEKDFFLKVFPAMDLRRVEVFLCDIAHKFVAGVVEEKLNGRKIGEKYRECIADVYSYAMVGIFLDWINHGMKEEPDALVQKFSVVLGGTLESTIENVLNDSTKDE